VFVLTHALAKDLVIRFGASIAPPFSLLLPDGVDLERYHNLPDPQTARQALIESGALKKLDGLCFTAGYSGHLYSGRGLTVFLKLAQRLPGIAFLLVGGEPAEIKLLEARVLKQGLKNVHLTGFIPNTDLPAFQAACDVLLMPYQKHVAASSGGDIGRYLSPMKLFEYMACRRPILSGDLPVLREVLDEQNSILLPPEDVEAWVAAIQHLKAHPETAQKLADQAYQQVQQYTWKIRAQQMLNFD
jgi:glycosyltransferase involved in cell wall biosynthesis